jgi:hypothetical protein
MRRRKPSQMVAALLTSTASAINLSALWVDTIVCPNIRSRYRFAVANVCRN